MAEYRLPITVYLEDTDAGGIVYHANFLKYMERARTEFITELGYDKPATFAAGLLLVVHSLQIDYRRAAYLADRIEATAAVHKLGRTYVTFDQQVWRGDAMLTRATVKVACVTKQAMKPAALPAPLREALQSQCQSR